MPIATATIIAGIGLAVSAVGAYTSYTANQEVAAQNGRQEQLRKQQMDLNSQRQNREIMRRALIARSMAANSAANQGAGQGDSSVVGGGAQATGHANQGFNDLGQNSAIAGGMFASTAAEASARGTAGFGAAVSGWGSGLVQNSDKISTVGQSFRLWGNTVG